MKTCPVKEFGLLLMVALLICMLWGDKTEAETLKLPSELKVIENEAFYGDTSINNAILPQGVTTIKSKAFAYSSLERIYVPESVTSIANDAFVGINSNDNVKAPIIHGVAESYAQAWAENNGYTFVANSDPDPQFDPVVLPWLLVTIEDVTSSSISISWNAVENATSYSIFYDTATKGNPLSLPIQRDVGNVFQQTLTGLTSNTTYHIWVKAYNNSTEIYDSDEVTATTTENVDPGLLWAGPEIIDVYCADGVMLTIVFEEYNGASGYDVFFTDEETGEVVTMYVSADDYTQDGVVSANAWMEVMLKDQTNYRITIKAIEDGHYATDESSPAYYMTDFSGMSGEDEIAYVYPDYVSLNITEKKLRVGDSFELSASITPLDVSTEVSTITWGSFDEQVAVVEDGEVYATGIGATVIYAQTENNLTAYCEIIVIPDPVVSGEFTNGNDRMIVKYGYEDYLNYYVEVQYAELESINLVQVTSKNRITIYSANYSGKTEADGSFTISAAPEGDFRSLGSIYNFELVASLTDGSEVVLDSATVEIGFGIPKPVENVDAYYSNGNIEVTWENQGDAKWFKVIYIEADQVWAMPGSVDVKDSEAGEATISSSAIEPYKTYMIYVVAYPTDGVSQYTARSEAVHVTTVDSSTPAVTARFVGGQKVYAPGETIQIEITYKNVIKVHYHNGDISYNPNALQTGINNGDIGTFSSDRSGFSIVELEAQTVPGWYMVEINAKNENGIQASHFYNYTTNGNVDCLGLSYYVSDTGLDAPSWQTNRSMAVVSDLFWTAVSNATGYRVWVSTTNDIKDAEATDVGNTRQYTLTGLITGRPYYVWVQATNSNGGGAISAVKRLLFGETTPKVSASITNSANITPGGQIEINITYENIMKVHYQNGVIINEDEDNNIWADENKKEAAEYNISGERTVYLRAQDVPGTYTVTIWAKAFGGKQATDKEGLKIVYTVTGKGPDPQISINIMAESSNSIYVGAGKDQAIWLTHTYSRTTNLVYTLHNQYNDNLPTYNFTTWSYYDSTPSLPSFPFKNLDYSEQSATGHMTFIPSPELKPGKYTLRATATNDLYGSNPVIASIEIQILENDSFDPLWPASGGFEISCLYYYKNGEEHATRYGKDSAIDIAVTGNALAAEAGYVHRTGYQKEGFGNWVEIKHSNGSISLYAHLASIDVSKDKYVNRGDIIGIIGNTGGASTGTHLHFEISGCNPMKDYFYDKHKTSFVFQSNVYSNNKSYNSDGWICEEIDNYYTKTNGKYIYSLPNKRQTAIAHAKSWLVEEWVLPCDLVLHGNNGSVSKGTVVRGVPYGLCLWGYGGTGKVDYPFAKYKQLSQNFTDTEFISARGSINGDKLDTVKHGADCTELIWSSWNAADSSVPWRDYWDGFTDSSYWYMSSDLSEAKPGDCLYIPASKTTNGYAHFRLVIEVTGTTIKTIEQTASYLNTTQTYNGKSYTMIGTVEKTYNYSQLSNYSVVRFKRLDE